MDETLIYFGIILSILIILIFLAAIFDIFKMKKISEFFEKIVDFFSELKF